MAVARETSRSPKNGTLASRLESFTLASAESQNWKESLRRATSCFFGSVAATLDPLGAATPPIFEQRKWLPSVKWATTSPKLICAGVGLNPYLLDGICS